jgi:hypothetical protein
MSTASGAPATQELPAEEIEVERRVAAGALVLSLLTLAGCATTKVTPPPPASAGAGKLPRPAHIVVYDFAATSADIASDPDLAGQVESAQQTPEEIKTARELGQLVAKELVSKIRAMGLAAARAAEQAPQIDDIVIKGYFSSVDEGSATKRVIVGFGSGAAEVNTVVKGYQMTHQGLRLVGSGEVDSRGGKGPGMLVPLAVVVATANPIGLVVGGAVKATGEVTGSSKAEGAAKRTAEAIAERLRDRFEEEGWID